MNLKIKYFGLLAEITDRNEETIVFSGSSIADLLDTLIAKYPELKEKDFQVAQDHEIVSKDSMISAQNIALLPPFSGG